MEKGITPGFSDIDSLPLAIKKFMKSEYLIFYEESKQNEAEVEALKNNIKKIELSSTFGKVFIYFMFIF